jgi:hypothetical protein
MRHKIQEKNNHRVRWLLSLLNEDNFLPGMVLLKEHQFLILP